MAAYQHDNMRPRACEEEGKLHGDQATAKNGEPLRRLLQLQRFHMGDGMFDAWDRQSLDLEARCDQEMFSTSRLPSTTMVCASSKCAGPKISVAPCAIKLVGFGSAHPATIRRARATAAGQLSDSSPVSIPNSPRRCASFHSSVTLTRVCLGIHP